MKKRGNPYHDEKGRFASANTGRLIYKDDTGVKNTYYKKGDDCYMRHEEKVNGKWKRFWGDDVITQEDFDEITESIRNDSEQNIFKKFIEKQEEKQKAEEEARIQRASEVKSAIDSALEKGERLPKYEDEFSTQVKMRYLQEKYGDTPAQAEERKHQNYTVVTDEGEPIECFDTVKRIDGQGNTYYIITDAKGKRRIILSKWYDERKDVKRINGDKIVGIEYEIYQECYKTPEQFQKYIDNSKKYSSIEEYKEKHGYRIIEVGESGHYYLNGEAFSITGVDLTPPWDKDPEYNWHKNKKDRINAYLDDHPKYIKADCWKGIEEIRKMSEDGVNIGIRRKKFDELAKTYWLTDNALLDVLGRSYMQK